MKSLWELGNPYYIPGNPYNWRTWLRILLPWVLSGKIRKGQDCETAGSVHRWYNLDNKKSACYNCVIEKEGQLWRKQA